jgi:hypothetical protein
MRKGRLVVVVLLLLLIVGALQPPSSRAATVMGNPTEGGCVKQWWAWVSLPGNRYKSVGIQFHLTLVRTAPGSVVVRGQWQDNAGDGLGRIGTWNLAPGEDQYDWFVSGSTHAGGGQLIVAPPGGGGDYAVGYYLWMPWDYAGCFKLERVVVTTWHLEHDPGESSPDPGATPTAPPQQTMIPGAGGGTPGTPPDGAPEGKCWVPVRYDPLTGNMTYELQDCETPPGASPSPSATPSVGCPTPFRGVGTFNLAQFTTVEATRCAVWLDYVEAPSSGSDTITLARMTSLELFYPGHTGNCNIGQCMAGLDLFTSSSWTDINVPPPTTVGAPGDVPYNSGGANAPTRKRVLGNPALAGWVFADEGVGIETLTGVAQGRWVMAYVYTGVSTAYTPQAVGARGSFTVSGTVTLHAWPTASPSPSPSPTGPSPSPTLPPGWPTPGPSEPPTGSGPGNKVEICGAGTIASGRLVCARVPPAPSAPPGDLGDGDDFGIDFDPEFPEFGVKLEQVKIDFDSRGPFVWIGEVGAALNTAGYAGGDLQWCFAPFGHSVCVNPYAVTNPVAGFRPIFLGLLLVLLAWALARRVWASVGGTPGGSGEG